jgi:hypothetical protein
MKKFWHRLVPMLKCWSVLIPVNLMEPFESVLSSLEKVAASPELIAGALLEMMSGAHETGDRTLSAAEQRLFDPP